MRKSYVISCILLLFHLAAFSQKPSVTEAIPQLERKLQHATGSKRVDLLNDLAEAKANFAKKWVDKSEAELKYGSEALALAENIHYKKGILRSLLTVAQGKRHAGFAVYKNKKEAVELYKAAEAYLLRGLPIAEELKDNNLLGETYGALDIRSYIYDDDTYTIESLERATSYYIKAGNKVKQGELSTWLCERYSARGAFEKAFPYCQMSLKLAEEAYHKAKTKEEQDYKLAVLTEASYNISYLYQLADDYETAMQYELKSYRFVVPRDSNAAGAYNLGFANAMIKLGKPDSAEFYLSKAHSLGPSNEVWYRIGKANVLVDLKRYDEAISLLQPSLENYRKGNPTWRVLLPLVKAYNGKQNYTEALKLATESFSHVSSDQKIHLMNHYEVLSQIHAGLKHHDSAYYYLTKYHNLKDSILTRQYLWKLNKLKTTAIDEKKAAELALLQKDNLIKEQQLEQQVLRSQQNESELSLLDKDNKIKLQQLQLKDEKLKEQAFLKEQQQSQLTLLGKETRLKDQQLKQQAFVKNALLAGLFFLLLLGIFIFRLQSLKRKNERLHNEKIQVQWQQQSSELEMQALRAQMNPHFIFNCLSSINKFILKNESRAASDYLTRFSRLIRRVLTNSQLATIPLSDELETLRLYLDMERLRFDNTFDYNIVYANAIEPEMIYIPPMLLQPFCENAIWHGLMHKEGQGKLDVVLQTENNHLYCTIIDNGIGRTRASVLKSKSGDIQKSFGLKITTERLALFNQKQGKSYYHVEDMLDEQGNVSGTKVSLVIKYKDTVHELANA